MKRRRLLRYSVGWAALSSVSVGSLLFAAGEMQNPEVQTPQSETASASDSAWDRSAAEKATHRNINSMRQAMGESALMWRDDVAAAAREYAQALADAGQLTHTLDGTDPTQRYQRAGIADFNGENIHQTWWRQKLTTDAGRLTSPDQFGDAVAQQWFESASHRKNIMRSGNSAEGIGVARSGSEVYVVQVFTD